MCSELRDLHDVINQCHCRPLISKEEVGYKIVKDDKAARRRERIGVRKRYYLHISQNEEDRSFNSV